MLPLLERARHGIEFFGLSERARERTGDASRHSRGVQRFAAFCDFLADLARCTDYRLLSNVQMQGCRTTTPALTQINGIVDRITEQRRPSRCRMASCAAELGMSESRFSRFFRRATGNTFTDFVNRVRINRACQLLMETDRLVTHICYEVGFNNVANFNRRFLRDQGHDADRVPAPGRAALRAHRADRPLRHVPRHRPRHLGAQGRCCSTTRQRVVAIAAGAAHDVAAAAAVVGAGIRPTGGRRSTRRCARCAAEHR